MYHIIDNIMFNIYNTILMGKSLGATAGACVKGTRIMASAVLDNLAAGYSVDEIVKLYPTLHGDDVAAVVAYAAELAR
jgi:uncharacterized protein (DUF433 family)